MKTRELSSPESRLLRKAKRFVAAAVAVLAVGALATESRAADHGDAPTVRLDTRLDINDVYAFQSPTSSANTVLIMTTNPVAGITGPTTYNPKGDYDIQIDNNNDAKFDVTYRFKFRNPDASGNQSFSVFQLKKNAQAGKRIATGTTNGAAASVAGGGSVTAGLFDDPFFFDLFAFRNGLAFCPGGTGTNFFRGLNTMAIVLEVPSSAIVSSGSSKIGVVGRTRLNGKQIDRMGRPAINTVLVKTANKDKFNRSTPQNDFATYGPDAKGIILSLGNTDANATALVQTLFPDILTFDTASSAGFLNGRRLDDDVIDAELNLLTNGAVTSDCVANDSSFRSTFPYLAVKNP